MIIFVLSLFLGLACGMLVSVLPFILMMFVGLLFAGFATGTAQQSVTSALGQAALVAVALQIGYVAGIWIRSLRE